MNAPRISDVKYIPLFMLIQCVSLVLSIIGIPLCAYLALTTSLVRYAPIQHWPRWAWLWDNDEDGVLPPWYVAVKRGWPRARIAFYWTALRNPCNNLRYIPGVSRCGRPLLLYMHRKWYFQAGWNALGHPVLSGGTL